MPTRQEVEALKSAWKAVPTWDLEDTEGFEAHKDELKKYQMEQEMIWEEERRLQQENQEYEAERLGLAGLHRLVLGQTKVIERQQKAIEFLCDGEDHKAYRALRGWEEE